MNKETISGHPVLWRVLCLVVSAGVAFWSWVAYAFGQCHDAGGFCTGEYDSTNTTVYAASAFWAAVAAVLATLPVTRKVPRLALAAVAAAILVALAAIRAESG